MVYGSKHCFLLSGIRDAVMDDRSTLWASSYCVVDD